MPLVTLELHLVDSGIQTAQGQFGRPIARRLMPAHTRHFASGGIEYPDLNRA